MSISVQNMRFLSSAVPEILRGPKIWKVGHATQATPTFDHFLHFCLVCPNINLRAKFQVSSFSRSRDIRGSRNLKSRSRDPGHAPFWPFFTLFCLVWPNIYLNAKFQVSSFSRSRDIRGSQNLKSRSRDPGHTPFDHFYTFSFVWRNINLTAKFQDSSISRSRDNRGSQNLKSALRDPGHAPFWPFIYTFCFVWPNVNLNAKFQVSSFSRSRDIRVGAGSQNLKSRSRDPGHVPFCPFYTLFLSYDQTSICVQNFKFIALTVPEILGGPKIWKVGHVTCPYWPFLIFLFSTPRVQYSCKI